MIRCNNRRMNLLVALCLFVGFACAADWSYSGNTGVNSWAGRSNTECDGSRQSPIDIPWTLQYENYAAFTMTGYSSMQVGSLELINNGHTAQINIDSSNYGDTTLSGGGLNGTYHAIQLHFHWGRDDTEGSEHTFRGRQYPLEMHVVHYKPSYGTLTDALAESDGLAVLGFFFTTEDADTNSALDPLINELENIKYKDASVNITVDFSDLMPDQTDYYRYMGSLTTPECTEAVAWTVFDNVNTISAIQMAKFRLLLKSAQNENEQAISWNYRPTQALNGRTVYKNFNTDVPSSWSWGYEGNEGPDYWPNYYETCTGTQQSPINIPGNDHSARAYYDSSLQLDTLEFGNYDQTITGTISNNGHTIQVDISSPELYIQNGNLGDKYIAAQFHFHWGADDEHGSEHTLEQTQYPLELHVVHYKESYGSLAGSLSNADGLAVVGFLFELSNTNNTNYDTIMSALPGVQYKDSSQSITGFNLLDLTHSELQLDNETGSHLDYFRYSGGLTTPSCSEIVTWSVIKKRVPIHSDQLAEFRKMTHITSGTPGSNDYITHNYRPTQSIASRNIYSSFQFTKSAATTNSLPDMITMSLIFVLTVLSK